MAQTAHFLGFYRVVLGVVGAMLAASSAEAQDVRAKSEKEQHAPTVGEALPKPEGEVRAGLAGSFLSGRFAKQNKDIKEAAKYLAETLAHDPNNEPLQRETMRMQVLAGDMEAATVLARKLAQSKNNEPLVASLLLLESLKTNDFAKAKSVVEQSSGAGLFGLIRPVLLEWIAVGGSDKHRSVDMKSAIDKAGFFAPFINYHAGLMNDVLGNASTATAAYSKANVDPAVTPYRVVEAMANFYQRQGKLSEAQAVYDVYATANPQSSLIPDKLDAGAASPKPLVADAKQGIAELYFTTASILFGEDAAQDTFLYLQIALELRPNFPPAQLMLANLYEQVEDYSQAIATYDSIPEGSVFFRRAQVRKALNYEALGQKEKAVTLLDALAARNPTDATALITKGDMQRDAKKYAEAAETYGTAIARTEPLKAADWPLLYARGISYERAGDWARAEADFMRALKVQPDQPDVLNYLGYSWLTMNKNLPQARDYLENAAAQRPEDAHIIDSLGWAYYLTGDFPSAVTKFEAAVEMMPDDSTVNDHLGDAYWRVGRKTEARYQWERALTFKPEKEAEHQLREKLANGLPPLSSAAENATKKPQAAAARVMPTTQVP